MKTSTIGSQKVFKDIATLGMIESGIPKITYPLNFTTSYFQIEQDYVVDANQVPTFIHGTSHSKYPTSKSLSQTGASLISPSLAKFTRKFAVFPNSAIEQPSTSSVTYPSIAIGVNYSARGIETVEESYQTPSPNVFDEDGNPVMVTQTRDVPAVTNYFRKYSLSKVIPVISRTSFIYLGNTYTTQSIYASGITSGMIIGGRVVASSVFDGERYLVTYEDGTSVSASNSSTVNIQIPIYNISAIDVDEPFKITDNYDGYQGAEVEFIDDHTTPSRSSFLSSNEQEKLLFSSQIEHIEGYLYLKRNIYGLIQ